MDSCRRLVKRVLNYLSIKHTLRVIIWHEIEIYTVQHLQISQVFVVLYLLQEFLNFLCTIMKNYNNKKKLSPITIRAVATAVLIKGKASQRG